MSAYDQYLAVKADLRERYPEVNYISIGRMSFNMVYADVEAVDLHHTVTYFFKGNRIDDSWVRVTRGKCNDACLHSRYPQENPHAVLPKPVPRSGS